MAHEVDADAIRRQIEARQVNVQVTENWLTPAGRQRSAPMFEATIRNEYLRKSKTLKAKSLYEIKLKGREQFDKWDEQELKTRVREANQDATERAEEEADEAAADAKRDVDAIRDILAATLDVDDRLDWDGLQDRSSHPPFLWKEPKPKRPDPPTEFPAVKRSFFEWLVPSLKRKRLEQESQNESDWNALKASAEKRREKHVLDWERRRDEAAAEHEKQAQSFREEQQKCNESVKAFRKRFEEGVPEAIVEYLDEVFERSEYPSSFFVSHNVSLEGPSKTIVVDVTLPPPDDVSDVEDFKFVKRTREAKPVRMNKKAHAELYDSAVKQTVLRTLHEVFEAVYTDYVAAAVVNGWVTYVDAATGLDKTSCIISVSADREGFEQINLERVDPTACVKNLKGLIAGPLSQVAPVQPVLQLDRNDSRFVESEAVLAELNSSTNLAMIDWEQFEQLVRELFAEMFSGQGAQVEVTQASRDGGVDAVAFDPDPIRGGKFVIQAKRYTKVVPVSAVRDLYGTMINEGASRGILVTTAYYGRDTRSFAQDKPLTLIDGSNLVHLLEQHGHKVRIDIEEARRERLT